MQTLGFKVIVRIEKEKLFEKRNKIGSLFIPAHMMAYTRNLQFAEVVSFGRDVPNVNSMIYVGAIAIFHHIVEGTSEKHNSDDERFLDEDDKYEYRYLIASKIGVENELFAIYNTDTNILSPSLGVLMCKPNIVVSSVHKISDTILDIPDESKKKMLADEIEILSHAKGELLRGINGVPYNEATRDMIDNANAELKLVCEKLDLANEKRRMVPLVEIEVMYSYSEKYKASDIVVIAENRIYPLEFDGFEFALIRSSNYVLAKKIGDNYTPNDEYCIIKPDDALKSYGSIVAPDNMRYIPKFGTIISSGCGSPDFHLQIKAGDHVNFNSKKSQKIYIDGKIHYLTHVFELMYIGTETEIIKPLSGMVEIKYSKPRTKIINIEKRTTEDTIVSGIVSNTPKHESAFYAKGDRVWFNLKFAISWNKDKNSILVHSAHILNDIIGF